MRTTRHKLFVGIVLLIIMCFYALFSSLRHDDTCIPRTTPKVLATDMFRNISRRVESTDVMLFSYMRGGSTLVGEFYKRSAGTFYVFEPLIPVLPYHYLTDNAICKMRNNYCEERNANNSNSFQQALSTINKIYSCKIRDIPKIVIDEILQQNKSSIAWWNLRTCLNTTSQPMDKQYCFDEIEKDCKNAEIKIIKELRLSFSYMKYLLDKYPRMHVFYLHRDPRAILNSRISTDWFPVSEDNPTEVMENVDSLCIKMKNDLVIYDNMLAEYKHRMVQRDIERATVNEQEMVNLHYYFRPNYEMQKKDREFLDFVLMKKNMHKNLFRNWQDSLKSEYKNYTDVQCATAFLYLNRLNNES